MWYIFPWWQWLTANSEQWPSQFCWPQSSFLHLLLTMLCDTASEIFLKLIKFGFSLPARPVTMSQKETKLVWLDSWQIPLICNSTSCFPNAYKLLVGFLLLKHSQGLTVNWFVHHFPVSLPPFKDTAFTLFHDWYNSHLPWALSNNCWRWLL